MYIIPLVVIARRTVAELFDSVPPGIVLWTFMQHSFKSLPELASDVISGMIMRLIVDALEFGYIRLQSRRICHIWPIGSRDTIPGKTVWRHMLANTDSVHDGRQTTTVCDINRNGNQRTGEPAP